MSTNPEQSSDSAESPEYRYREAFLTIRDAGKLHNLFEEDPNQAAAAKAELEQIQPLLEETITCIKREIDTALESGLIESMSDAYKRLRRLPMYGPVHKDSYKNLRKYWNVRIKTVAEEGRYYASSDEDHRAMMEISRRCDLDFPST